MRSCSARRGLVKIRGVLDGEPFDGALMAQGDGTHRLPVKAKLRKAIGKKPAKPSTCASTSESGCRDATASDDATRYEDDGSGQSMNRPAGSSGS